mgnify:CR=1 FL=1
MLQFIRNLKFWQKLLLIVLAQTIPLGVAVWSVNRELSATIAFTERELAGLAYAEPVADLASDIAEHRVAAATVAAGSDRYAPVVVQMIAHGNELMLELERIQSEHGAALEIGSEYAAVKTAWQDLVENGGSADAAVRNRVHETALEAAFSLRHAIAESSGLAVDPDLDTTHFINIAVEGVPDLLAFGGALAGALDDLRQRADGDYSARAALSAETGLVRHHVQDMVDQLRLAGSVNPTLATRFESGFQEMESAWGAMLGSLDPLVRSGSVDREAFTAFSGTLMQAFEKVHAVHDPVSDELRALLEKRLAAVRAERNTILLTVLAAMVLVMLLSWWISRAISQRLQSAVGALGAITRGDYSTVIAAEGRDEIETVLGELGSMRDKLRAQLDVERALASENQRIRQALDSSSSSIMLADTSGQIVFMNRAASKLFTDMEPELRRSLPKFQASKIVGSSFDIFHANASEPRGVLQAMSTSHTATIPLASRKMQISAYPVLDEKGARIGVAVEWLDRTAETRIEKEVADVLGAAADGDLAHRLALEDKTGFLAVLSKQVNGLLDVNQRVFGDISRVLDALARGRLTERVVDEYKGTYAKVKEDANATVDKLVSVVQQIQMSSDVVNAGALQLAQGNENLSQRTTEQAASLEETAASIEELTSTVRHNADNASQANQLATATRSLAEKGGDVVGRAVGAMRAINQSSKQIADIIGVIDEIAFQTNLLALNAAVEAARAGEQGRGFAVVASEVRTLAQRSAESAKEIKTLIQDSVAKVDDGTRLVDESGKTLEEIVGSVKRVTDLIAEITSASREQATGVEEVNRAVTQMDQVTTQNAALVDEASAGTHALADQARTLSEIVSFFNLGTPSRKQPAAAAPAATVARPPATQKSAAKPGTPYRATKVSPPAAAMPARAKPMPVPPKSNSSAIAAADAESSSSDWDTF